MAVPLRTDEGAIRVFVSRKEAVPESDAVPAEIEGVPTDVIEEGEVKAQLLSVPLGTEAPAEFPR